MVKKVIAKVESEGHQAKLIETKRRGHGEEGS